MRLFPALALTLVAGTAAADPAHWARDWPVTDFSRTTVDFAEVISGGPPRDGIPAIDRPGFRPAAEETRLDDREPVLTCEHDGEAARRGIASPCCAAGSETLREASCPRGAWKPGGPASRIRCG